MRIFLVRHGESMGNVDQSVHTHMADHAIPLSPRGHEQAAEAGAFLRDYLLKLNLDPLRVWPQPLHHPRLWVSPYKRTRQTADGIEAALQLPEDKFWPSLMRDRREHILLCEQQFGLFDGVPDDELPIRFPEEHAHYAKCEAFEGRFWARMPMGESRFDVAQRVHQAFGTFHRDAERHNVNDIIVICHGVTLRAFVMMWLHLTPEWFEAEPNPKNCAIRLIEDGEDKGYIHPGG